MTWHNLQRDCTQPWNIAAPSFVIPAHIRENALFLAGKVREVGLCFFESVSCMAYGVDVLPATLAQLPLTWHVHLPLDLCWEDGGIHAADIACRLMDKIAHLMPTCAVLHPPRDTVEICQQEALMCFSQVWQRHCSVPLLLENIPDCDLTELVDVLAAANYGVCFDIGHYLGYQQHILATLPDILARVALVHWSAPGRGDEHRPLTALTPWQEKNVRDLVLRLPQHTRHMLEIFSWQGIEASMPVLMRLLQR